MFIGVWLRGLCLTSEEPEVELVGFVAEHSVGKCVTELSRDELLRVLADAPMAATFRSVREASQTAAQLRRQKGAEIRWYRATFDGGWTFAPAPPPQRELLEYPPPYDTPVGDMDRGINPGATIYVLPPPLQQRGFAVAVRKPGKANAMLGLYPRDLTLSVFASWSDLEDRVGDLPVEVYYWQEDRLTEIPWGELRSLR